MVLAAAPLSTVRPLADGKLDLNLDEVLEFASLVVGKKLKNIPQMPVVYGDLQTVKRKSIAPSADLRWSTYIINFGVITVIPWDPGFDKNPAQVDIDTKKTCIYMYI